MTMEKLILDSKLSKPFPHFWENIFGSCHAPVTLAECWRNDFRTTKSGNGSDAKNNLPRGCNQPRTAGSGFDRNLSRMSKDLQSKGLQKLIQRKNRILTTRGRL